MAWFLYTVPDHLTDKGLVFARPRATRPWPTGNRRLSQVRVHGLARLLSSCVPLGKAQALCASLFSWRVETTTQSQASPVPNGR